MKNIFHRKRRPLSFMTALILILTQAAGFAPASTAAFPAEVSLQTPAFELELSPDLGTIQTLVSGPGPALVHIQTAHGNYQAQKKIQAILHHLKDRYGFKELFLEGSPYELEPEFIRFFPGDPGLTRRVADALSRKALLKGAELFLIEEKDARGHGIEDLETYKRNVEAFRAVLLQKKHAQKFLSAMEMQIDRLSSPYLNKNLRDFLKRLDDFESNPPELASWLGFLKEKAGQTLALDLSDAAQQIDWPMLLRYFKLRDIERRFEPQVYEAEKEKFLKAAGKVPGETLVQIRRLLDVPLGEQELPDPQTGLLFESLIAYLPQNFAFQTYPQTALFITHLILQSELKGARLMGEMRLLEDKIAAKLAQNETERKLVELFKDYRLLKKLFALELTPEDYQRLRGREHDFEPARVADRFVDINQAGRVRDIPLTPAEDLDGLFAKALEFYAGVQARDGKMLQKLEAQLAALGADKAVVITGGFHARPFEDYFRARGFNYALVAPKMTKTGGREKYEDVMLQSRLPASTLESIFQALPYRKIQAAGFNPRHFARAFAAEARRTGSRLSAPELARRLNASRQLSQYPSAVALKLARSEIRQDDGKPSVQEMFKARQNFQARATAKDIISSQAFTNVLALLEERQPKFEQEPGLKNLARRVPAKKISGPAAAHLRGALKTLTMPLILKTLREKISAGQVIQLTVPDTVYRNYLGPHADLNQLAWAAADGNFYISNRFFQYLKELRKNNPERVKEVVAAILVRLAVFDLLAGQLPEEAAHSEGLQQALEKFSTVFERAVSGGSILDPEKSAAADMARMFLYQERFSAAPMPAQVLRSLRTGVSTAEKLLEFFQESLRENVVLPYYENRQIYQKRRSESAGMREKREGFIRAFGDLRRKYRAEILRTDESQELSTARLSYLSERVLQGIERLQPQALQERISRYHARYQEILQRMARYAGDETKQDRLARLNESARDLLSRLIFLEMQPSRIDAWMQKEDMLPDSANYKTLDARFRALRYHLRAYERELLWLRVREAGRREVTAYVVGEDWESGVGAYLLAPEFFARERRGEIVYPAFITQGTGRVREEAYRAVQDQVKKLAKGAVEREMIRYRRQRIYLQDSVREFLKPYWEEFDGFKDFMIERLRGEDALQDPQAGGVTLDTAVDQLIRGPVHEEGLTAALLDDFQQFLLDSTGSEALRAAIEERFQFSLRPDVDQVSAVIEGTTYKSIFDLLRSYNHTLSSYAEANLTAHDMLGFVDDAINRLRALTRKEFAQLPGAETMEKAARDDFDADLKRVREWSDKGIKPSRRIVGDDLAAALLAIQFQDLGLLRKAVTLARADILRYIRENMRISKFIALKAMGMRDFVRRPVQVLLKSARVAEAVRVLADLKNRQLPPRFTDPGYQRARKRLWRVMKALERMDGRTLLQKEGPEADELRKRYVRQLVELELIIYDIIHKRTLDAEFETVLPELRADVETLLLNGRTLDQTTFTPQVLRELHERVLGRSPKAKRSEMRRERSPGTIRDGTRRSRSEMRVATEQEKRFEALLSAARSFAADFALAPSVVAARLTAALSNGKPKETKKKNLTILAGFGILPEEYRAWLTGESPSPPAQPLHLNTAQLSQTAYKIRETSEDGSFRDSEVTLDGLSQYGQPEFELEPFYDADSNSYGFEIYGQDRRSFGALILRRQGRILPQPVQWLPQIASSRPADADESQSAAFDREKRAGRSSSPVTIRAAIFERLTALVFHGVSQGQALYRSGFALDPLVPGYIYPDLVWDGAVYDAKLGSDLEDIGKTLIKYSHLKQIHAGYFKGESPLTIVVLDKTATQDFQLQGYAAGTDFRFISLEEFMQEHRFQNAEFQQLLDALHQNGQSKGELKEILSGLNAQVKQAAIPGGKAIENGHVRRRLSSGELTALVRTEPGQLLEWVRETLERVKNHQVRPQYINEHYARLAKQIESLRAELPDADWIAEHLAEHEKVFEELASDMQELSGLLRKILPASIYSAETLEPARSVRRAAPPAAAIVPASAAVPIVDVSAPELLSPVIASLPAGQAGSPARLGGQAGATKQSQDAETTPVSDEQELFPRRPEEAAVEIVSPPTDESAAGGVATPLAVAREEPSPVYEAAPAVIPPASLLDHLKNELGSPDPELRALTAELDILYRSAFPGFETLDRLVFSPESRMRQLYAEIHRPQPDPWWDADAAEARVNAFLASDFTDKDLKAALFDFMRAAPNRFLESEMLMMTLMEQKGRNVLPEKMGKVLEHIREDGHPFKKEFQALMIEGISDRLHYWIVSLSHQAVLRYSSNPQIRSTVQGLNTNTNKAISLQSSYGHLEWFFVQDASFFWETFVANLFLGKPEIAKTILRFLKARQQTAQMSGETPDALRAQMIAPMELLLGERMPQANESKHLQAWTALLESHQALERTRMEQTLELVTRGTREGWSYDEFSQNFIQTPQRPPDLDDLNPLLSQMFGAPFQLESGGRFLILSKTGFYFAALNAALALTEDDNALSVLAFFAGSNFRVEDLLMAKPYYDAVRDVQPRNISYTGTALMGGVYLVLKEAARADPAQAGVLIKMLGSYNELYPQKDLSGFQWSRLVIMMLVGQAAHLEAARREEVRDFFFSVEESLWSEDADLARASEQILREIFSAAHMAAVKNQPEIQEWVRELWSRVAQHFILQPEKRIRALSFQWLTEALDKKGRATILDNARRHMLDSALSQSEAANIVLDALLDLQFYLTTAESKQVFEEEVIRKFRLHTDGRNVAELRGQLLRGHNFTQMQNGLETLRRHAGRVSGQWPKKLRQIAEGTGDFLDRLFLDLLAEESGTFRVELTAADALFALPWSSEKTNGILAYAAEHPRQIPYLLRSLRTLEDEISADDKNKLHEGFARLLERAALNSSSGTPNPSSGIPNPSFVILNEVKDLQALKTEMQDLLGHGLDISRVQQTPAVLPLVFSEIGPEDFLSVLPGRLGEAAADAAFLRVYPRSDTKAGDWADLGLTPLADLRVVLNERLEHQKNYTLELSEDGLKLTLRLQAPLAIPGSAESFGEWIFSAPSKKIEQVSPRFQHLLLQMLAAQKPESAAALKLRDVRDFKDSFLSHWEKGHLVLENAPAIPYGLADENGKNTLKTWVDGTDRLTPEDQAVQLESQAQARHAGEIENIRGRILKRLIRKITPDLEDAKENLLNLVNMGISLAGESQLLFQFNPQKRQALEQRIENLSAQTIAGEALASGKGSAGLVEEARSILKRKFDALADELEHIPFEENPAEGLDAAPAARTSVPVSALTAAPVTGNDEIALAPLNPPELAQRILDYYLLYDLNVPASVVDSLEEAFSDFGQKINRFFPKADNKSTRYLLNFAAFMKHLTEIKKRKFTYKDVLEMSRAKIGIEHGLKSMMQRRLLNASEVGRIESSWNEARRQFKAVLEDYGFQILAFTSPLLEGNSNALIAGFFDAGGHLYVATRQAGIFQNIDAPEETMNLSALASGNRTVEEMLGYFPKPVRGIMIPETRFSAAGPADVYQFQGAVSAGETLQFQSRLDPLLGAEIGPAVFVVEHAVMMAFREVYPGEGQFPAPLDQGSFERFLQALRKNDERLYEQLDKTEAMWRRLNVLFETPNASMNDVDHIDAINFDEVLKMAFTPALDELPVDDRQYLASGIGHLMSTDPHLTFLDSYAVRKHKIPAQEFNRFEKLFQAMLKRQNEWLPVMEANYEKRFGKPGFEGRLNPALGSEIGPGVPLFYPEVLQAIMKAVRMEAGEHAKLGPLDPGQYRRMLEELRAFPSIYDKLDPSEAGRLELNRLLDVNSSFVFERLGHFGELGMIPANFEAVTFPAAANTLSLVDFALLARYAGDLSMDEMRKLLESKQARRKKFSAEALEQIEPIMQRISRVSKRLKPVMEANFLKAVAGRSEMRLPLAPEIAVAFRVYRAQLLPLRLETYGTRALVALLSGLLNRTIYSERAGILQPRVESVLAARLGRGTVSVTPAGQQQLSQMSAEGRVLLESAWMEKLIQKSPRALYVLLTALDQFQSTHALTQPLIAVSGKDSLLEEIARALQKSTSGLNAEEKAEARHFLEPGRLRQLVQILPPEKIPQYIREQNYGVATLSTAGSSWLAALPLGAQFLLDPSQVAGEDLMALAFLIPSLLKAAQEVRGIEGAALQKAALIRNLQQIVWGAFPQTGGQGFAIRLSAYIENVLVNRRLVDLSA